MGPGMDLGDCAALVHVSRLSVESELLVIHLGCCDRTQSASVAEGAC
jgi:hypothetical protein